MAIVSLVAVIVDTDGDLHAELWWADDAEHAREQAQEANQNSVICLQAVCRHFYPPVRGTSRDGWAPPPDVVF